MPAKHFSAVNLQLIIGLLALSAAWHASALDWPEWGGGPSRNMFSTETNLPAQFDPGKFKAGTDEVDLATARNLKWVAKLGSASYGNVTVAGGRVYVGTNNDPPRDPRHQGDRGILLCLAEPTGEVLWQLVVPKLAAGKVLDWDNIGQVSSPVIQGDHVYLVTTRDEVLCLDAKGMADGNESPYKDEASYAVQDLRVDSGKPSEHAAPPVKLGPKDADIIWVCNIIDEFGAFPHNAANCSPLLAGGILYAGTSNGRDWTHTTAPFPFAPSLVALDPASGRLLGADDAGIGSRVFHGQWGSPSLGQVNGRKLVLFGAGDGWCYAFDLRPSTSAGEPILKTTWRFDCNPPEYKSKDGQPIKYPEAEGPSEICSTPVCYSNRVYIATGQDPEHGEGVGRLVCIDASGSGDITQSGLVWDFRQIHRTLSTASIDPSTGLLFIADFSGFVYCLDAATGKLHWTHDMKAHVWGSTMVAGGKVYVGDEDGDLVVLAATKEKRVLSTTTVDGRAQDGPNFGAPIYSTPVAANNTLYLQTASHLYAFGAKP